MKYKIFRVSETSMGYDHHCIAETSSPAGVTKRLSTSDPDMLDWFVVIAFSGNRKIFEMSGEQWLVAQGAKDQKGSEEDEEDDSNPHEPRL